MTELPKGWVETDLAHLVSPRRERVLPQMHAEAPFLGLEHVEAHSTCILGTVPASTVRSSATVFRAGDVLYGRLRPYLNKVARPDFGGLASAEFMAFPDQPHLRSTFLKHRLNSKDFVSFTSHLNAGDRPRIDFEQMGSFKVLLPPASEQERIAAKLDELLSDLDAGTAALERARANLKRYRSAILTSAVQGRLSEPWRRANPDSEPAGRLLERILAERRKRWEDAQRAKYAARGQTPPKGWQDRYPEPVAPDTSALPELPEGWCWATVEQVSDSVRYGSSAKTMESPDGVPVLRMGNLQNGGLDFSRLKYLPADHCEFPELFLQSGDVLFNRTNSAELVGKTAVYRGIPSPCSYASYLIAARPLSGWQPDLLSVYINSAAGRAWVASVVSQQVGQANVNGSKFSALAFPFPPALEQVEIVRQLDQQLSVLDRNAEAIDAQLARAGRLRQAILKRAFEGRLVPQDPNDEPAEKLLERIRAERATAARAALPRRRGGARRS